MTRFLALDVGGSRVGLAVSDPSGLIASPLTVIRRRSKAEDFERIANLVRELGVDALVVGHPLDSDGQPGPQARRIERYAVALVDAMKAIGLDLPVHYWDESLSTQRAQDVMRASGRRRSDRRSREDAVAAAIILQEFLESRRADARVADTGGRPTVPSKPGHPGWANSAEDRV